MQKNKANSFNQMDPNEPLRLSKYLAQKGYCSRREADVWIEKGWVSVDGEVVKQLGTKILPTQFVEIAEEALKDQKQKVTIVLNKPVGYVSSTPEHDYKHALSLITKRNQDLSFISDVNVTADCFKNLAPCGRLDIDSKGLMLFTQDGRLAKKIIGENSRIEKEYIVKVKGNLSEEDLQLLNHGLELDGKKLKPAKVEWINESQLRFVLKEGKKRQIRRMLEAVNMQIIALKRVRIGKLTLGKLKEGQWRFLESNEEI